MQEYNVSVNSKECFMMMEEGVVLSHFISSNGIQVDPKKIEVISNFPTPEKQKDGRRFLGHASYYGRFIKDFSQTTTPLYNLLKKDSEFSWDFDCDKSFMQLKEVLTIALVLRGPNWGLLFHIYTDAFDYAIGVVLGQKGVVEHSIYFISKNLQGAYFNYIVT